MKYVVLYLHVYDLSKKLTHIYFTVKNVGETKNSLPAIIVSCLLAISDIYLHLVRQHLDA